MSYVEENLELLLSNKPHDRIYWAEQASSRQKPMEGGCPGKGRGEIVDPGAYTEEIFDRQQPDFQKANDEGQK
jgi:hypothetical protein